MMKLRKFISALCALTLGILPVYAEGEETVEPTEEPIEVVTDDVTEGGPEINAPTAIVMDMTSGNVLYYKNMDDHYDPASLTKMMTVLTAVDSLGATDIVTLSAATFQTYSHDYGVLWIQEGEAMSVESAVYASLLASANDTTAMLAEAHAGSNEAMVDQMNAKAQELGLSNTHFTNIFGWNNQENYSSVYDLAILTRALMKDQLLSSAFGASSYTIPATNKNEYRVIAQDCQFLRSGNYQTDSIEGCKIGYTNEGGWALAAVAQQNNTEIVVVVMAEDTEDNAYRDVWKLMDYGFSTYQTVKITSDDIGIEVIEVMDGKKKVGTVTFSVDSDFDILLPASLDTSMLTTTIQVKNRDSSDPDQISAQVLFLLDDATVGTVDMNKVVEMEPTVADITGIQKIKQIVDYISLGVVGLFVLVGVLRILHNGLRPPE